MREIKLKEIHEKADETIIEEFDLKKDEFIKRIHEKSNEIIQQLKEKQEKCNLNAFRVVKINLKQQKLEDLASFKRSLRSFDLKQEDLNSLNIHDI